MKRNYLLTTLVAAGTLLLGAVPSFAACPAGTIGTQLAAGQWAIKIEGFRTDTGVCNSSCPDPTPQSEGCIGVIQSDGACDITGGDVICSVQGATNGVGGSGITAPAHFTELGPIAEFAGTVSPANDVGSYFFNSNNTGEVVIQDTPSGKTFAFGVVASLGNLSIKGANVFSYGPPGPPATGTAPEPLIITLQKRDQTITQQQFLNQDVVTFDPAGGGSAGSALGQGFDSVAVGVAEHVDPETGTVPEGGGSIFFNIDAGYDTTFGRGTPTFPSSLICDFHENILAINTGDGTQLAEATLNADYACPLAGATFDTVSVAWGLTNTNAYIATVGGNGATESAAALGEADRAIIPGSDQGGNLIFVTTAGNPNPTKTITVTNGSTEPLDWSGMTLGGASPADFAITGGTCAPSGDLSAWNPLGSPTKPTCTINVQYIGNTLCTTGSPTTATLELTAADHAIILGTATATGEDFTLKCQ